MTDEYDMSDEYDEYRPVDKEALARRFAGYAAAAASASAPSSKGPREHGQHSAYPCEACGKVYVHRSSLSHHRRYECGKEPQFQCPHCPHRCKRKGNLRRHLLTHDT